MGWTLAIAGIGFGIAIVPVTSSALSSVPGEHSGMAASATNTSRELGAVAGVAILGSIVNGQLTVNLIKRLNAIGIPHSFQSQVIAAVTTGSLGSEAEEVAKEQCRHPADRRQGEGAAYRSLRPQLELALYASAALARRLRPYLAYFMAAGNHPDAESSQPPSMAHAGCHRSRAAPGLRYDG